MYKTPGIPFNFLFQSTYYVSILKNMTVWLRGAFLEKTNSHVCLKQTVSIEKKKHYGMKGLGGLVVTLCFYDPK